jgi:hypothetical protein
MFKYTKASIELILEDIRRYCAIFRFGSLSFTSIYFIYALIAKTGNFYTNLILAIMFFAYTIFDLATQKRNVKRVKKVIKRSYGVVKFGIRAFTLGATIYGFYTASTNVNPISTVLTTLMIIMWVLQVLLELVSNIFEDKKDLVLAGINKDIENMKKPVTDVGNFFKKVTGQEIEPAQPMSKEEKILEKRVQKNKEKEEQEKLSKKEQKRLEKEQKKENKKIAKLTSRYQKHLKELEEEENKLTVK